MNFLRTIQTLFTAGMVTGLLFLAGCAKPPQQSFGPPQVTCITVQQEPVTLTTELPGRTSAYLVANIIPRVNGIIQQRLFEEGSDVRKGSTLYQIDPEPYQAAYDQAAASVKVAEAALPSLHSRLERLEKLLPINAVGEQDVEDAKAAVLQAEANAAAARAALETARIQLSYTPITAPISGRIGHSSVTIGGMVIAYQPLPLATIQQLDPIYVDVQQATSELLRLRHAENEGELAPTKDSRKVRLILEDGTPYRLEGTLAFRDITVDPTTGSVRLRMIFPNPDGILLPGMFVRALIEEGTVQEGILAPQQAITRDAAGHPIAYLVNAENSVEVRPLELDRAIGDRWLVTGGLAPGDQLIIEGRQNVRPGAQVIIREPVPEGEAPAEAPPAAEAAEEKA